MPRSQEQSAGLTYDPELGPGYFVQTRSDFLRSPAFSPTAKVLYCVLLSYAGEGASAWPGQERLAECCAVSDRTIRRVLKELEDAGLVTVKQQGLNRPNLYHLHKLPLLDRTNCPPRPDRPNRPVKSGQKIQPKQDKLSREVHAVKLDSDQLDRNDHSPALPDAPRRPTPAELAAMTPDERLAFEAHAERISRQAGRGRR